MVFSSAVFLFIFLPVVFVLSRVLPGIRAKNILLLIASLLFYAFGEPVYILLMLASILVNFTAGRLLPLCGKGLDKLVLALAVVLNLGMLSLFKYTDFFLTTVNQVFSLEIPLTGIALPVGISFFTFQGLSYVIDVYRDREMCSKSIVKLALYISLFPQLIAGPIVIYHDVANQIDHRETNPELTADGIRRFVLGLGKKLLLANTAGRMADLVFTATAQQLDIRVAWLGRCATACRSTLTSPATATWPSAWGACSASSFWKTSTIPTSAPPSRSSGGGGTSACPPGSGITCTSPWGATARASCAPR